MSYLIELEKAEHEARDLEFKLASAKDGISGIDRELALLTMREIVAKDNLMNLKKNSVAISASEYRRTKEELNRIQIRKSIIKKDMENIEKTLPVITSYLEKAKAKLDELKKADSSNVLQGDFSGQKDSD